MKYKELRHELREYYSKTSYENAKKYLGEGTKILDEKYNECMSSYEMKVMQYRTITDMIEPVLFENSPFYYETGIIPGYSDGARQYHDYKHIGGWTYWKNNHKFIDQDREMWSLTCRQRRELFYLVCGEYNDTAQHFLINHRPIFEKGLRGVYEDAQTALKAAEKDKEKEFLTAICDGLLCVKKIAEKFADRADKMLKDNPDNQNLKRISVSARRCPWEKPQSFYEAINTYAFMRKIIGSLEGIGVNSFGRVDVDLYPFYENDIKSGRMTKEEAFKLISQFLITFDSHYDHDKKMAGYADHELENTYVLGGCDTDGKPVFNELTKMFLKANNDEKIIFPKIKCRFSENSPKEYLDLINEPIIKGTSTILYQNDDASIPALIRCGVSEKDARDYLVSGCWDLEPNCSSSQDCGSYTNILKVFEYQIHNLKDKMDEVGMQFKPIDDAQEFDEVYKTTCDNINTLFKEKIRILTKGGQIWESVDPLPIFSSLYGDCLEKKCDYTNSGARYRNDTFMCVGFPNIVDSLMAIKTLCFDKKRYTLKDMLNAVRNNWEGYEEMRADAMLCHGWGDGNDDSCTLAKRFNTDLYAMLSKLSGQYSGKVNLGHLTYTEIRFWGERTLATPDGRHNGEYFSQGLTPSRLKKIPYVTSVINSMAALDKTELAGNTVVNIILPESTTLDLCEAFLRATASSAVESLQLNCVSKKTLLDAQKHPEKYPDLIVRVCGFSAKFTSLSPEWQEEVITRNFYK